MAVSYGKGAKGKATKLSFWSRVDRGDPAQCWEWTGSRDLHGYGQLYGATENGKRKRLKAHRVALELHLGRPLQGCVCHHCDNPPCCNPAHLYDGTHQQNMADAAARGRMARGARQHSSKLTEQDVREIRQLAATGELHRVIGAKYGVIRQTVDSIVAGKRWRWLQ